MLSLIHKIYDLWFKILVSLETTILEYSSNKITKFAHILVFKLYTTKRSYFDYPIFFRLENFQTITKLQQFENWQD